MSLGWTGKMLRVNMTNGAVTTEDSKIYHDYLGGTGLGNRLIYDEVKVGTMPTDEGSKIVFAVGPNTGSSSPCSGRITISLLSTFTKYNAIATAHMGGDMAVQLKYAGYDALIIEGKSTSPKYLVVNDDKVSLEDATALWGTTTRETTAEICKKHGQGFNVTSIGLAGENMVNLSCVMSAGNHCGGSGSGAILGSKMLKAIAIYGTGSVKIADTKKVLELNKYVMSDLMGSNNNHVVPSTPQSFAEYSDPGSRWTGRPGLTWGAAEGGPVDTGESPPGEPTLMGFRCQKAEKDLGPLSEKYLVKMTGCASCPVRCCSSVYLPELEKEGYTGAAANTCMPNFAWTGAKDVMNNKYKDYVEDGDGTMYFSVAAFSTADDLGLWDNYGELPKTINYFFKDDCKFLKMILPKAEFDSLPWDKRDAGDAAFMRDIMYRISKKEGEIAHLGDGAYYVHERYKHIIGDEYLNTPSMSIWSPLGFSKHHGNETASQVGSLINMLYNRDCMCHTIVNITGSGLPHPLQAEIVAEICGEGALDAPKKYTPMNESKAKLAKFGVIKQTIHDSITLCNWVWPMTFSPQKNRNYRGDLSVEAQYMAAVTGEAWTEKSLDDAAEKVFHLHRAMTVKWMNTIDMRNLHDIACNWVYDMEPDFTAFEEGCIKMDRDDMQTALTMLYKQFGWDEKTGAPTRATLEKFGLKDVADDLDALKLLP